VGECVGLLVGSDAGEAGEAEGACEGLELGLTVGERVGTPVGSGVGRLFSAQGLKKEFPLQKMNKQKKLKQNKNMFLLRRKRQREK